MRKVVNVHAAKTHLSRLIEDVLLGEEVVIARAGVPVAALVPVRNGRSHRTPGGLRGQIELLPDFDAPLPPDVARSLGAH